MYILATGNEIELPRVTFVKDEKNGVIELIKKKINIPYYVVKISENDENYISVRETIKSNLVPDILLLEAQRSLKKSKEKYSENIELLLGYIKEIG